MSDNDKSISSMVADVLETFGDAGTKLGSSGGAFGMAASVAGGALSIAGLFVRLFGDDAPVKIPEFRDGLARKIAEDRKVDSWLLDTLGVDMSAPPHGASKGGERSFAEIAAAARLFVDLTDAADLGRTPLDDRLRAARVRLRNALDRVKP